jgi:electron transfer flavoprotein alpha subunit
VTSVKTPGLVAVLDGTGPAAERQTRALGAFVREGATLEPAPAGGSPGETTPEATGLTLAFYADERDRERLVRLAPTRDVHLVRTPGRRPDLMVAALEAFAGDTARDLFVFPGGPLGTELATRLACRAGGGVVTDARRIAVQDGRLVCSRSVYSGHLDGRVELDPRPWCVTADAGWYDAPESPPGEHRVVADSTGPLSAGAAPRPFHDVEVLGQPATGDLETARFLVVAGRGAGSPQGVERIAAAAGRMGAAFGVTRPVAMSAWAPMDRLVGVSGTRAAPDVCLVAGASGAPAFLWGIERAGFIAAVDIDEHAAIIAEADVAVIDDAVCVIEALADLVAGGFTNPHA